VIATDASSGQIAHAVPAPGIEFHVAAAEQTAIASGTISLITVASALHWFTLPAFYQEARRVLIPGGVLAAWAYRECVISPEIDALITHYQNDLVGQFWSSRIGLVAARYATIDFPLEPVEAPAFVASASFSASDMVGYLASWSASQSYLEAFGSAATTQIEPELRRLWGTQHRVVHWPLFMKVGQFR
jgi:SAM-dependent methyltransferase